MPDRDEKCSFCGKSQRQVRKLIAGPGVYICDECIDLCDDIIEEEITPDVPEGFPDPIPLLPQPLVDLYERLTRAEQEIKRARKDLAHLITEALEPPIVPE